MKCATSGLPQARCKARPKTRSAWHYWKIFWCRVGRLVAAPRIGRPTATPTGALTRSSAANVAKPVVSSAKAALTVTLARAVQCDGALSAQQVSPYLTQKLAAHAHG